MFIELYPNSMFVTYWENVDKICSSNFTTGIHSAQLATCSSALWDFQFVPCGATIVCYGTVDDKSFGAIKGDS